MVEQPGEVEGERGCVSRWCSAPWTATCRKAILTLPVVKHASTNLYRYEATYRELAVWLLWYYDTGAACFVRKLSRLFVVRPPLSMSMSLWTEKQIKREDFYELTLGYQENASRVATLASTGVTLGWDVV